MRDVVPPAGNRARCEIGMPTARGPLVVPWLISRGCESEGWPKPKFLGVS